jgi:SPP1 family predicted phage head-tail adaptor
VGSGVLTRSEELNRRLEIQRKTVTEFPSGEPIETWATLATVWAQKLPDRGQERHATRQLVGSAIMMFRMRYRADLALTIQDRLIFDGKTWDIHDIREMVSVSLPRSTHRRGLIHESESEGYPAGARRIPLWGLDHLFDRWRWHK